MNPLRDRTKLLIAVIVAVVVAIAIFDRISWEKYRHEHNCREVESVAPVTTHGPNGQTWTTDGRRVFECDDGTRHERSW